MTVAALATAGVGAESGGWPQFRGPTGQGNSTATGPPVEWSATRNVAWKQPIPGIGLSSPVLSDGQIFFTTATADDAGAPSVQLYCLDAETGRIVWRTVVLATGEPPPREGHERNSAANATVVVEDGRVYAYVGHHGAACFDFAGKVLWRNPRLRFDPVPLNGGSPIIAGDLFVYVADCATAPFVTALDKRTGEVRWRVPRILPGKLKATFGAPLLIEAAGRRQIIIVGAGAVTALDPVDGQEIWRVRYARDASVGPRPVFAHGLLFVSAGYLRTELLAIRPDGVGDVTDTQVAWRLAKGAPLTPGLVVAGDELYGVNDGGVASCWAAKTGDVIWQQRLRGNYSAAPI
ncbi:MAG: PQQ-binding-like beta-propeller repeat protein, partial [Opitutaceae bacterium]